MNKVMQFVIWTECNNNCSFCFNYGFRNRIPDDQKIDRINKILSIISSDKMNDFNKLGYLGGEFFQGQLNSPKVKSRFMDLMNKSAELYNTNKINEFWIYATLTLGDQSDLYEVLDKFNDHKGVWLLTSYDTLGRFTKDKLSNWSNHMLELGRRYPSLKFNFTTILTQDCIIKYLNDEINFKYLMNRYNSTIFFKQPHCTQTHTVEQFSKIVPGFFPKRSDFLKFLVKFKSQDPDLWDKLFNIKYRADEQYLFNNDASELHSSIRNKIDLTETGDKLPCLHSKYFASYIDSDKCMLCDKILLS